MADEKRQPERFSFTKARLEALEVPENGRRRYVYDTGAPGLALCVTPAGSRTFYSYRKVEGEPQRERIGRFPEVTIAQARAEAKALAGRIVQGANPRAERLAARKQAKLGDLFAYWMQYARQHKRPKSRAEDERQYNTFLKPWAGRRLATIKRADVQALHSRVGTENGPYAANRLLALIRAMWNKARDLGYSGDNPALGIKRFREQSRDRFLGPDELKPFFAALATEPNEVLRDFFLVCLFTGGRRANVQGMRWADVDIARGVWRIPPGDAKGGEVILVPLVPSIVEALRRRAEASNGSPWVFPGRGRTGHIVEPKSAWKRIIERAGLRDVRIHDLRRSLGSWQAALGASLPVIGKSLGHRQVSTTAVYARLEMDPVRASVEAAETAMLQAGGLLEGPKEEGGDDGED